MNNMKHIENFDKFNESWISSIKNKLFITDEEKIYNDAVKKLFKRVKDTFKFENLTKKDDDYVYYLFTPKPGKISIIILSDPSLYIDQEKVNCSKDILVNMISFFNNKIEKQKKIEKNKKALAFKDKYKKVTG